MFVLLIAAIAVIALVAAIVVITRSRARGRQDQLRARQAAAAQARAAAQAEEQRRRRALDDEDNLLTSVIPAIRLPWPTQLSAPREPGYQDLDGEYPQFSTVTPFHTGPADEPPARPPWPPAEPVAEPIGGPIDGYGQPDRRENGQLVPPRWQPAAAEQYPADPDEYPVDPDQYPAAPAIWDERLRPAPGRDARMAPAPVPAEHAAALERARRRPTHGSHRGGHARRRRT